MDGVLHGTIDVPSICPLYTVKTVSEWVLMFQPTKKSATTATKQIISFMQNLN